MAKGKNEIIENKKEENIKGDVVDNENNIKELKIQTKSINICEEKKVASKILSEENKIDQILKEIKIADILSIKESSIQGQINKIFTIMQMNQEFQNNLIGFLKGELQSQRQISESLKGEMQSQKRIIEEQSNEIIDLKEYKG